MSSKLFSFIFLKYNFLFIKEYFCDFFFFIVLSISNLESTFYERKVKTFIMIITTIIIFIPIKKRN